MEEKKKAQVSIEILVILGLLVVGAIVFSAYYISNLQHKVGTSAATQGTYADISENIKTEDPQQITGTCGDTICNSSIGENCNTCPGDCGCPEQINLLVYPDPNTSTPQGAAEHKKFGIKAEVNNYSDGQLYIKSISVSNQNGEYSDRCYYGRIPIPVIGIDNLNIPMTANDTNYSVSLENFSCIEFGKYIFYITVKNTANGVLKTAGTEKVISTLYPRLTLNPDGSSNRNEPFGMNIFVDNYNSDSDINITKIYVKDVNTNNFVNYCKFNGKTIPISGLTVNQQMTKVDNDYNLDLTNFACSTIGQYMIILTLHDNDETTDYDVNATIRKNIQFTRCLFDSDTYGLGTELDPYKINSASDLDCMRYYLGKYFILVDNIDLNHTLLKSDPVTNYWYDQEYGWWPIGTEYTPFTGSLDGNGYSINNLYKSMSCGPYGAGSNRDFFGGLFVMIRNGSVKDLNITNTNNSGHGSNGLAWYVSGSVIENVHVSGDIGLNQPHSSPNGLAQHVYDSNFTNCSFTGNIASTGTGGSYHGGLLGHVRYFKTDGDYNAGHAYSYITNCYTDVNYYSPASGQGGLVGLNDGGIISYSHSSGQIYGQGGCIGGLVGMSNSNNNGQAILNSYSDADVNGTSTVGGLIGCNGGTILNCYARGDVTTSYTNAPGYLVYGYGGGFAGSRTDYTANCYSTGNVTIISPDGCNNCYGAGFAINGCLVDKNCVTEDSFWDINTSGQTYGAGTGILGKTTTEMKQQSTFENADWNFTGIWGIDPLINDGYPYLISPPSELQNICLVIGIIDGKIICEGTEISEKELWVAKEKDYKVEITADKFTK